jgi:hypothetical protein
VSEARPPKVPALPAMEPGADTELALDRGPWSTHCFFEAVYVQRAHAALPGDASVSGLFSAEQSVQHWPEPPQGDAPSHSQPSMTAVRSTSPPYARSGCATPHSACRKWSMKL